MILYVLPIYFFMIITCFYLNYKAGQLHKILNTSEIKESHVAIVHIRSFLNRIYALLLGLSYLLSGILVIFFSSMTQKFEKLFIEMEVDLPYITYFMLSHSSFCVLYALFSSLFLSGVHFLGNNEKKSRFLYAVVITLLFLVILLSYLSIVLPVLKLEERLRY